MHPLLIFILCLSAAGMAWEQRHHLLSILIAALGLARLLIIP